jgi:hypothetical protein
MSDIDGRFQSATGNTMSDPFLFPRRFAVASEFPQLVNVPTGCDMTAMARFA